MVGYGERAGGLTGREGQDVVTMADSVRQQLEVDRNFRVFREKLPELLRTHAGKFALLRDGEIVDFFDTLADAARVGGEKYDDGLFSVQEVTERVLDLGYFSYAVSHDSD